VVDKPNEQSERSGPCRKTLMAGTKTEENSNLVNWGLSVF
jgi:hypothetical protein